MKNIFYLVALTGLFLRTADASVTCPLKNCFDLTPSQIEILNDIAYHDNPTTPGWNNFVDLQETITRGYRLGNVTYKLHKSSERNWGDTSQFQVTYCKAGYRNKCRGHRTKQFSFYRTEDLAWGGYSYEVSWD